MTYREFSLRDKLIMRGEKKSLKSVIYFVLEGECRLSYRATNTENIGNYSTTKKYHEVPLLNICKHDVIGVEILSESAYKYTYTAMT
jgi:CRP-like cAMP-binding protein